jgi:uncharacterized alpha-E superfamily protein
VLSRLADALYWMGRYLERADGTARVLDVQFHRLLETERAGDASAGRRLLEVMGVSLDLAPLDAESIVDFLTHDRGHPGSIASSLHAAWENARGARDLVPSELWQCLNATTLDPRWSSRAFGTPHAALGWVKERCAIARGVIDGSMRRDDAWQFLNLGGSIERLDITLRLLAIAPGGAARPDGWATLLRCCGGLEAYRSTNLDDGTWARALDFVLVDDRFPRSVLFTLREIDQRLATIDAGRARGREPDSVRRLVGRTESRLAYASSDELNDDLDELIEELGTTVEEIHTATDARYFDARIPISWSA